MGHVVSSIEELKMFNTQHHNPVLTLNTEDIKPLVTLNTDGVFGDSLWERKHMKERFVFFYNQINELELEHSNGETTWFENQEGFFKHLLKCGLHFYENEVLEGHAPEHLDPIAEIKSLEEVA